MLIQCVSFLAGLKLLPRILPRNTLSPGVPLLISGVDGIPGDVGLGPRATSSSYRVCRHGAGSLRLVGSYVRSRIVVRNAEEMTKRQKQTPDLSQRAEVTVEESKRVIEQMTRSRKQLQETMDTAWRLHYEKLRQQSDEGLSRGL